MDKKASSRIKCFRKVGLPTCLTMGSPPKFFNGISVHASVFTMCDDILVFQPETVLFIFRFPVWGLWAWLVGYSIKVSLTLLLLSLLYIFGKSLDTSGPRLESRTLRPFQENYINSRATWRGGVRRIWAFHSPCIGLNSSQLSEMAKGKYRSSNKWFILYQKRIYLAYFAEQKNLRFT